MTWTYNDPSNSDLEAVRFEIQDTVSSAPLLQDEEINYVLAQESPTTDPLTQAQILSAAAHCCEALGRRFAAQADTAMGDLSITYSKSAQGYFTQAKALRARAQGMQAPWAGGQSLSEKAARAQNPDLVQPSFSRDQFDTPYAGPFGPASPLIDESCA